MILSNCLSETAQPLVLDTSVVINLIATTIPVQIIKSLAQNVVVGEATIQEIGFGEKKGYQDSGCLKLLIDNGVVGVEEMDEGAFQIFEELVTGGMASSLGDGEAATIAIAVSKGKTAVIDEKKAHNICAQKFPEQLVGTTIELLSHSAVLDAVGQTSLSDAVLQSLQNARMQVRAHQLDWVIGMIGEDAAANCRCLNRLMRARNSK